MASAARRVRKIYAFAKYVSPRVGRARILRWNQPLRNLLVFPKRYSPFGTKTNLPSWKSYRPIHTSGTSGWRSTTTLRCWMEPLRPEVHLGLQGKGVPQHWGAEWNLCDLKHERGFSENAEIFVSILQKLEELSNLIDFNVQSISCYLRMNYTFKFILHQFKTQVPRSQLN